MTRGAAKNSRGDGEDLHFDFDTRLPAPEDDPAPDAGAAVGGFLEISPKVDFSYDGHGSGDSEDATAAIGLGGDYKASWRVKGTVEPNFAERIPLAEATAHPVIMVGPVPVVVTVKLTLALKVQANGRIQVDVDQAATGSVKVGTRYVEESGWEPDNHADGETLPGGKAEVSGQGELRTALGPEANVSLYDTVGVVAFIGPYLRATGEFPGRLRGGTQGRRRVEAVRGTDPREFSVRTVAVRDHRQPSVEAHRLPAHQPRVVHHRGEDPGGLLIPWGSERFVRTA